MTVARLLTLVMMIISLCVPSVLLAAPSFDCNKAAGPADRVVCASPTLSNLDSRMALEYISLRATLPPEEQAGLVQSQREWVRDKSTCLDKACLITAYDSRLKYFIDVRQRAKLLPSENQKDNREKTAETAKIAYASRAGMVVTVKSRSGIGTSDAEIKFVHTREDAMAECVGYYQDQTETCVRRTAQELADLTGSIYANCGTGIFTTVRGGMYAFLREHQRNEQSLADPAFDIVDLTDNRVLDGSSASGYPTALDNLGALCPKYRSRAEGLSGPISSESARQRNRQVPEKPRQTLKPGTGSMTPADFEVDKVYIPTGIVAVTGSIWCLSAEHCDIASEDNSMISVPFSTVELPRVTRLRLTKCGAGRTRCSGTVVGHPTNVLDVHLVARAVAFRQ